VSRKNANGVAETQIHADETPICTSRSKVIAYAIVHSAPEAQKNRMDAELSRGAQAIAQFRVTRCVRLHSIDEQAVTDARFSLT